MAHGRAPQLGQQQVLRTVWSGAGLAMYVCVLALKETFLPGT